MFIIIFHLFNWFFGYSQTSTHTHSSLDLASFSDYEAWQEVKKLPYEKFSLRKNNPLKFHIFSKVEIHKASKVQLDF